MKFYLVRGKVNYGFVNLESYKKLNEIPIEEYSLNEIPIFMIHEKITDHIMKEVHKFFHSINDVIIYLHTLQEDSWSNEYDEEFEVDEECISNMDLTFPFRLYEKKKYTYDILLTLEFIHLLTN